MKMRNEEFNELVRPALRSKNLCWESAVYAVWETYKEMNPENHTAEECVYALDKENLSVLYEVLKRDRESEVGNEVFLDWFGLIAFEAAMKL